MQSLLTFFAIFYNLHIDGGIAQSVEQTAHIRSVRGSSPFATNQPVQFGLVFFV